MGFPQERDVTGTLADVIDRILDKGLVINADIRVAITGVELLDIRIRAALASFETAARYGLEFPAGTRLPEWASQMGPPSQLNPLPSRNGHQKVAIPGI